MPSSVMLPTSLTFHFHETPTNELTICAVDPVSKIPETKVCAIKVEKIDDHIM